MNPPLVFASPLRQVSPPRPPTSVSVPLPPVGVSVPVEASVTAVDGRDSSCPFENAPAARDLERVV